MASLQHVLFDESGAFKTGTVLSESDASMQVETSSGKRIKLKSNAVILRFADPSPQEFLARAEGLAGGMDTGFLWECAGADEFAFEDLARDYYGRPPSALESGAILVKLHGAPMYFYRKGKGRYKPAPAETIKAALEGLEKKKRIQAEIDAWAGELIEGRFPDVLRPLLPMFLYKPDRNRAETRAVEKACEETGLSIPKLLERAGALPSSSKYHLGRFLFEYFAKGTGFPPAATARAPAEVSADLPRAEVRAFSLDDHTTTEIDDALSVTRLPEGRLRIGVHIAAPALGFAPGSPVDAVARERLSTVYMPGNKITMLPQPVIEAYSLIEGGDRPALSLYVDVREEDFAIERTHSVVELVPIAANLRHSKLESVDGAFLAGEMPDVPFANELHTLWRFALSLEAARGKPSVSGDRPDYSFYVDTDAEGKETVRIVQRARGTPLDKLVAELMILANSTWGKLLDDNGLPAIYRVQTGGKVRMSTLAAEHQGLGISHYAWSSSPLRRYVDLVNQWQLVSLLTGEAAHFQRGSAELLAAVSDFEATYNAYGEFQDRMENYWCLRWLIQENVKVVTASVVRDNLLRFSNLPYYARVPGLPAIAPGTVLELAVESIDLMDVEIRLRPLRLPEVPAR